MQDRSSLRGNFEFPVVEREGGFSFWCTALNLSSTGILIERGDQLERRPGSLVELELHLPDVAHPVRALATFVWSNGSHLGMKFVGMDDADRLTLAEALDALAQRGGSLN